MLCALTLIGRMQWWSKVLRFFPIEALQDMEAFLF